jgi:hypothetical protein
MLIRWAYYWGNPVRAIIFPQPTTASVQVEALSDNLFLTALPWFISRKPNIWMFGGRPPPNTQMFGSPLVICICALIEFKEAEVLFIISVAIKKLVLFPKPRG